VPRLSALFSTSRQRGSSIEPIKKTRVAEEVPPDRTLILTTHFRRGSPCPGTRLTEQSDSPPESSHALVLSDSPRGIARDDNRSTVHESSCQMIWAGRHTLDSQARSSCRQPRNVPAELDQQFSRTRSIRAHPNCSVQDTFRGSGCPCGMCRPGLTCDPVGNSSATRVFLIRLDEDEPTLPRGREKRLISPWHEC